MPEEKRTTDWTSLLVPGLIALVVSFLGSGLQVAYMTGGYTSRVTQMEQKQADDEAKQVTQAQWGARNEAAKEANDLLYKRLDRMDDKLDKLLMDNTDRRAKK